MNLPTPSSSGWGSASAPGSIIPLHVWYKGYRFVVFGELLTRLEEG
jgi:hypothetical protein